MEMNTNLEKLIDVLQRHKNDLTLPEDIYNAMTAYFAEDLQTKEPMDVYNVHLYYGFQLGHMCTVWYSENSEIRAKNSKEMVRKFYELIRPKLNKGVIIRSIYIVLTNSDNRVNDRSKTLASIRDIDNDWNYYVRFRTNHKVPPTEYRRCIATENYVLYKYSDEELPNLIKNESDDIIFDIFLVNKNDSTKYCIYSNGENDSLKM